MVISVDILLFLSEGQWSTSFLKKALFHTSAITGQNMRCNLTLAFEESKIVDVQN